MQTVLRLLYIHRFFFFSKLLFIVYCYRHIQTVFVYYEIGLHVCGVHLGCFIVILSQIELDHSNISEKWGPLTWHLVMFVYYTCCFYKLLQTSRVPTLLSFFTTVRFLLPSVIDTCHSQNPTCISQCIQALHVPA